MGYGYNLYCSYARKSNKRDLIYIDKKYIK